MTRKQVLGIAVMGVTTLLFFTVYVAIMPLWLPVLLAKPSILKPLADRVMTKVMQHVASMMFNRR